MSVAPAETAKVIYLVEKRPVESTTAHPLLEKIKHIAGAAIALFGLLLLSFAAVALVGKLIGLLALTTGNLEMAFMAGTVATVAGFNLATKSSQAAEVYLGPLSVTV